MPIFEYGSGFQILGGTFYEVAGDVHVHSAEASLTQQQLNVSLPPLALEDSTMARSVPDAQVGPSHSHTALSGVVRNTRHAISLEKDPSVVRRSIDAQLQQLIVEPLPI
ncbi:hypothetical protein C8J57DRAFT_1511857 [Mycena rebaudengoi]|nr:hypothetical protein C8J57DRAFT_1511857 [Mycena rebaudengoi]